MKKKWMIGWMIYFLCSVFVMQSVLADDITEGVEDFSFLSTEVLSRLNNKDEPIVSAASAVIIDMESGRVLFEKNAYRKMAMASTTKIMTAILAIEKGKLTDEVKVSKRAGAIGGSTMNLRVGQTLQLEELLYGLLLCSGNDAAIVVAEHIGGTVEEFAKMMNEKALSIGVRDTNFKSPHGLDMEGHYSTAYDMGMIARYALNLPKFASIVSTKSCTVAGKRLQNTNEILGLYLGADGVKTGYTGQAGRCLVASATRNKRRTITVVLNCETREKRARNSMLMLDYAFENFTPYTLLEYGERVANLEVVKGKEKNVAVLCENEITIPLKSAEMNSLEKKVLLPEKLDAPVYAGTEIGCVQYILNEEIIAYATLTVKSDIPRKKGLDYFREICSTWFLYIQVKEFL